MKILSLKQFVTIALFSACSTAAVAQDVEVLHFWTSGGEAKALQVLKDGLEKKGYGWSDVTISGGGGGQAKDTLGIRVASGKAPTSVTMGGVEIQKWAKEGDLANLNDVALKQGWDEKVPTALQEFSKYDGKWVSAPANIHRINWMWANKKIFDELNLQVPQTFDELLAISSKIKEAGYIPLAHGGQAWQNTVMFDNVVMSVGGADFYRKALIDLDIDALSSPTMVKVFDQIKSLRGLVDDDFLNRDWSVATSMVMNGEAAMQIMGDWAKGEFSAEGKKANEDYLCFEYPGTQDQFLFLSDQFAMFKVNADQQDAQLAMAEMVMDESFQEEFNLFKGSIPANISVSNKNFDPCGQKAMADLKTSISKDTLIGSMAMGHANQAMVQEVFMDAVTDYINNDFSSEDAVKTLVLIVKNVL